MGRELLVYPAFKESLGYADDLLLHSTDALLEDAAVAQPLCTVLQVALTDLLTQWNIVPKAVIGHSSGEIAAAYCARAISRETAYRVAYYRGVVASKLSHAQCRKGAMLAVALSMADIQPILDLIANVHGPNRVVIGCINSPQNITLTGDEDCIKFLQTQLDKENVFTRKLPVPVAYHSPHMQDVADEYLGDLQDIDAKPLLAVGHSAPPLMFSSVTGQHIEPRELRKPEYWVRNLTSPVQFAPALISLGNNLARESPERTETSPIILIEVGPRGALRRPVEESVAAAESPFKDASYDMTLQNRTHAIRSMLELVGRLHCRQLPLDLNTVNSSWDPPSPGKTLVDLPPYPFNHSRSYWLESQISQNYRFGRFPRHELLGVRTPDWNPLEAKWRHIIRASELPWIKDHAFNGTELYPAAGIMVMALEAARQMADPGLPPVTGYSLESVSFHRALLVNLSSEGVEVQFHLRPESKVRLDSRVSDRNTFTLYQQCAGEWIEISRSTIVTHYGNDEREPQHSEALRQAWLDGLQRCRQTISSSHVYDNLADYGFGFGPTFQGLQDVHYNMDREATAIINLGQWNEKVKHSDLTQDHLIHPTALDALMQTTAVAESRATWTPLRTMVPTQIGRFWISNQLLAHTPGQFLRSFTTAPFRGYRETSFTVIAYDNSTQKCQILFEGYRSTAVTSLRPTGPEAFRVGFDLEWRPDVDLLTPGQAATICTSALTAADQMELVCLHYLDRALREVDCGKLNVKAPHMLRYIHWLRNQVATYEASHLTFQGECEKPALNDTAYFDRLTAALGESPGMQLYNDVGSKLTRVLGGEIDPLEILYGDGGLAEGFYRDSTFAANYKKAAAYINLLVHKEPQIEILEVGAGTGGSTAVILDHLAARSWCGTYTYTDVSPGFFPKAADQFHRHASHLEFKVLDIEKDPTVQEFKLHKYDVVVASSVLHATRSMEITLRNVHQLLKPGGKLILIEPCNLNAVRIPFVFGLLPGWWLGSEDSRSAGPLLSEQSWDGVLRQTGFDGNGICLRDFPGHQHTMSLIITTAIPPERQILPPSTQNIIILVPNESAREHPLVSQLKGRFAGAGPGSVVVYEHLRSSDVNEAYCISLMELANPFLLTVDSSGWGRLKPLVRSVSAIIWVTRGRESDPSLALASGLGRTLLSEFPRLQFIDLALQASCSDPTAANHIQAVIRQSLVPGALDQKEHEYEERHRILHINRIVEAEHLNTYLSPRLAVQHPQPRILGALGNASLHLSIREPGLLITLYFQEIRDLSEVALAEDEVEVEVKAIGLTHVDCLIALGQIPANCLGMELSGIFCRLGRDAAASHVRIKFSSLLQIPNDLSFPAAAAVPVGFCLAHYALFATARCLPGETVLIHSGASGVGQAAIQLALLFGASIYTTIGSAQERDPLCRLYSVSQDCVYVARDLAFVPEVKARGGVDILLNFLAGEGLRQSVGCLRAFGRIVDLSLSHRRTSAETASLPQMPPNLIYATLDLQAVLADTQRAQLVTDMISAVQPSLAAGRIQPPSPIDAFSASAVEEAFHSWQDRTAPGKVVIEFHENDAVPVVPSPDPTYAFRPDSSYVIVGGLGGLGRSTARWMAGRDAQYLILLGRSGAENPVAPALIQELEVHGVQVAAPALRYCRLCLRSEDAFKAPWYYDLFETTTVDDYLPTIHSKTIGSWNLHRLLPSGPNALDFFILLASASGIIGTRGQCNYAAANTYMDALARYRACSCIRHPAQVVTGLEVPAYLLQTTTSSAREYSSAREWMRWVPRPLFRQLTAHTRRAGVAQQQGTSPPEGDAETEEVVDFPTAFQAVDYSRPAAARIVATALQRKLARALRMPPDDIELQKLVHAYGVDSLVAVELRYWLGKELQADISVFELMAMSSVVELSVCIVDRSALLRIGDDGGDEAVA
ncbi:hypothetical protein BO78DRAFT_429440 [Aspergillus sclerotiicarbonarius CBS 121057]|uniref:Uncharacterized protein n=1 Tax=Aspergillus sclerotiicarbonarius (strain CBS 121057 / IBT 28362) TaxID=1448318 RepID=A0A319ESE0_ASPSB|nr:hypothetical protein BO78DRAFT_429440 [Aspergillus sclerotiicarbonarius CBS 121057]